MEVHMSACFIVQSRIKDEAQYQKYVQAVVPFIASFGGRLVARRAKVNVLEGEHDERPVVMFEFPNMEATRVLEFSGLRSDQETARRNSHTKHLGLRGRLIGLDHKARSSAYVGEGPSLSHSQGHSRRCRTTASGAAIRKIGDTWHASSARMVGPTRPSIR
jgi:uncharacterized protein (DUF1330 family)